MLQFRSTGTSKRDEEMRRRTFALGGALAALGGTASARKIDRPPAATGDRLLEMTPMVATRPGETHSALAVSTRAHGAGAVPYRFSGAARTLRQLRTGSAANAWEVAWVFWNFQDNNHLYYFILKPNGWEIGKRDPRYVVRGVNDGQKIMATGEAVKASLGEWYRFDVRVNGAEADIFIDGQLVCRFQDSDGARLTSGRVGLYTEDACCQWNDVSTPVADGFDMEPVQALADGSQLTHWQIAYLGYGAGGIVESGELPF
jgi:hypothetical protein